MKFGSIGASLVRWLQGPATPVTPEIDHKAAANAIAEAIRATGLLPPGAEVRVFGLGPGERPKDFEPAPAIPHQRLDGQPIGLQPPPDPAIDGMTWPQWENELVANGSIPGWSFCRFGHRTGKDGGKTSFVFGHVRGGFGVWRQQFSVCTEEATYQPDVLTCLTHLRTGSGIGVFAEYEIAIEAAELAERVCPGWHAEAVLKPETWDRAQAAWQGAGIRPATNAHAHDGHGNVFQLIGRSPESVMEGKPEKLS